MADNNDSTLEDENAKLRAQIEQLTSDLRKLRHKYKKLKRSHADDGKGTLKSRAMSSKAILSRSTSPKPTPHTPVPPKLSHSLDDTAELDELLREAARKGATSDLTHLISLGVDLNQKDESGYTALHWSAINGREECIRILLKAGANVNICDHGGWSALHYASFKGHKDCVSTLLLIPSIDIEMKNSAKKTAAQVTVSKEIQSMLKTAKKAESRVLLEQAKKFWQADVIKQRSSMPEEIQQKEKELLEKEKALLEKERTVKRLEGELGLLEQTIKRKQQEDVDKREEFAKKEESLAQLEKRVKESLETQTESDISNAVVTVSWSELEIIEEVGQGTFGSVFKAKWRGDYVAAKRLKCKQEDTEFIQAFQKETKFLAKLRHPNITMLMGACCYAPDLCIITELMKGDLFTLLNGKDKLDFKIRIQMAIDIARGMVYLHNLTPIVIHRDLKSGNLLVDESYRVKVSDFGSAISKEKMGTELVGTAAWMSPERLRGEQSDEKTDVFSFGVVLWELLTRKKPWDGLSNIQIIARVGHAEERLPVPDTPVKGTPSGWISMIRDCWENYPSKRPSFVTLLEQLRETELNNISSPSMWSFRNKKESKDNLDK